MSLTSFVVEAYVAVVASRRDSTNNSWRSLDRDGGEFTFRIGLSPDGNPPATWYWCHTYMRLDQTIVLSNIIRNIPDDDIRVYVSAAAHGTLSDVLARVSHDPPKVEVVDDMYTKDEVLTKLGLQVVTDGSI